MQQGWVVQVVPGLEESFGHYLGRFRRANCLSHKTLGEALQVPLKLISDWESPSRRRNPDSAQLERLSQLVGLSPEQLAKMFPPAPLHLRTRLCPTCYGEVPIHRVSWQQQGEDWCNRHQRYLLSACPACKTGFRTPALWDDDRCEQCQLPLSQMHMTRP